MLAEPRGPPAQERGRCAQVPDSRSSRPGGGGSGPPGALVTMAARGDSRPRGYECILGFLVGGLQHTRRPVLPGGPMSESSPCCKSRERLCREAFPNHFRSSLCLLCSSVVRFNKVEAMCLGPGAAAGKKPRPQSAAHGRPPHSPACTALRRFSPPSPRCGGRLQERAREVRYSVLTGHCPEITPGRRQTGLGAGTL